MFPFAKEVISSRYGMLAVPSKNLVKKYGNHLAVDHLDFQIKPGMEKPVQAR